MLVGGSVLVLISAVRGEWDLVSWHTLSGRSLGALGYLVIVGSLVAFPTFVWLMQHCAPSRVSTYAYVNPVVAVALGWLIMDEPVTPRTLAAAVVILGAVAMITALPQRKVPAPSRSDLPRSTS